MGYYVNNEYPESEEQLREEPPEKPILEKCAICNNTRASLSSIKCRSLHASPARSVQ